MQSINIGNRIIGKGYSPLVIAELGINHNGSLKIAFEMVDAAYQSGAEIIKHQTHVVKDEMSKEARNVIPGNSNESIYQIMERCSLSEEDEIKLKHYVESKDMIFLSTPFSREAANRLERMGVVAYKIGSGECNNYPLIEHIALFGKPMIISTGMNSIKTIEKTVKILEKHRVSYALLHTTNLYPTPSHLVRLEAMKELENNFPNAIIGLSDHTVSNLACFSAVALGASIIERHFTDTKERVGPDIINSMDSNELKELIEGSREIHKMLKGEKKPLKEEKVTIDFAFSTVVTIKEIKKNEYFTKDNIWVKRPNIGDISADNYTKVLGKKASKNLEKDIHLSWNDIYE